MNQSEYLQKVYGGLLGKCAGVRLGAPVEPTLWTYERIRDTYGEITGYVKNYKNFAADDDINGPLFFIRSLVDYPGPVTAEKVGRSWLNYTREGIGFYWWGGYGRSTEHTVYLNLKSGIKPPESGSATVNGLTVAEQIGGQIFIDSWGWVFPDNPDEAARHGRMAASVGHDRNGIYGGIFMAVCNSLAFSENKPALIIEKALSYLPEDSEYVRVVTSVREFYQKHPEDWRSCRDYLDREFGYDRYPGVCHIIPNAGVCALALYYGGGDFARTIEIATMCGWDTDCNAGNAGSILGVINGPEGIPDRYRRPINDFHAASSIAGALNNMDLPTKSRELAVMGLRLKGEKPETAIARGTFSDDIILDFSLPGSTCGLRSSSDSLAPVAPGKLMHRKPGVSILLDRLEREDNARIYYKPYYRREDFDDERYRPSFTPLAYPGQTLKITGRLERFSGSRMGITPFVRDAETGKIFNEGYTFPAPGENFLCEWRIPEVPFAVAEAGLLVMNVEAAKFLGNLVIEEFSITGKRTFTVKFKDEKSEFDGLSRCSAVGGSWMLENGGLHVLTRDYFLLFSGPYYTKDSRVSVKLVPENGESHLLAFRARGAEMAYYFGLHGKNRAALLKRGGEDNSNAEGSSAGTPVELTGCNFPWVMEEEYSLEAEIKDTDEGCRIQCFINGKEILDFIDTAPHPYGMAGAAKFAAGRTLFLELSAKEN